jgi:D-lactate dehydrogenase
VALCCGVPFSSKDTSARHATWPRARWDVFEWSDEGRYPIVVDTSPCAYGLKHCGSGLDEPDRARLERLTILDSIEFAASALLPRLHIFRRLPAVILHTVCSAEKMGLDAELRRLAEACSEEVFVPPSSGCCGFAGDRGWLVPELTASATAIQAAEVHLHAPATCYSSSRTCEIGMARATGRIYRSYIHMLEWASRPSDEG